jgi:hypothetical protein
MKTKVITFIALLVISWGLTVETKAQFRYRTFVSSTGSNSNTCEQSAPCRTFAGVSSKTEARGEITALC